MAAVSNSSPLIALAEIGQLALLPQLFDAILVPPGVVAEIGPTLPVLPAWVEIRGLLQPLPTALVRPALGLGEREALALALESKAADLILDDRLARELAILLGLPLTGTLGILVAAKEKRLIESIRPHLDRLLDHHFFIGRDLYRDLLSAANELDE